MLIKLPPYHRIIGLIILIISACINLPAIINYSNLYTLILYILNFIFFIIFIIYTYLFINIEHYNNIYPSNNQKKHLSSGYIQMIKNPYFNKIRKILLFLYYITFISSWILSSYLYKWYDELTIYQKTIFAYNYNVVSFTIMYIYEHQNIQKYLSLGNIELLNENERLINQRSPQSNILCPICIHFKTHPPIHRIFGFLLLLSTLIANIPVLFTFSDFYALFLITIGMFFFGLYSYYTFKFLKIHHYSDDNSHHISLSYVKMIQNDTFNFLRHIMIILYYIIFISLWAFPTYMQISYNNMTPWQKTMFTWNYTISSFTIMYLYEHKDMNKYLSMDNIIIYDYNDNPINIQEKSTQLEDI
jgi:hypothetical protein